MGIAAKLFFDASDTEKQTLHRRITLSDDQFADQQDSWNALAEHLTSDLKERSGYSIRTWLQGSYKFATQIRPTRMGEEFDIDLGVYFQWQGEPDDGDHEPEALKGFVQQSLLAYAKANPDDVKDVAEPKTRCARIRYKSAFHIDVPAYHLDPNADLRCLATEDGWEDSDPKAIYVWFRDAFDDLGRARVRRQIRYLKSWAALNFAEGKGRPSSILLTVLVAEAALELSQLGDDDQALGDIVDSIIDRLEADDEVPNPVDKSENVVRLSDDEMQAFVENLRKLQDVAARALNCATELAAADVWQEAFQHLFPMPEIKAELTEMAKLLPVAFAMPQVEVTAVPRNNSNVQPYKGTNSIGPIPKDCDIYFEVTNPHALPADATVVWMVRNEGGEAENTNDLGHYAGTGLKAQEHSAYRGTHYMDCSVKVNGRTVAMRRVPVQISGLAMPRRNPRTKPAYTRLFGRR
jgi:hypothetical protein